ncbi:hypothetical protein MG293_010305 [Ovis ammon polii]|uniref:Uncharacterized protein n=1 Tax=Ovis ammon polii TaxID=230172 RepID=A0AAD4U977_OVIAM|nr:hypothetical protein MG293_010305 [Ovis ammon polii]
MHGKGDCLRATVKPAAQGRRLCAREDQLLHQGRRPKTEPSKARGPDTKEDNILETATHTRWKTQNARVRGNDPETRTNCPVPRENILHDFHLLLKTKTCSPDFSPLTFTRVASDLYMGRVSFICTSGASQGRESAPFQLQPSEVSTLRTDPLPGRLQRTGDWRGRTRNGRPGKRAREDLDQRASYSQPDLRQGHQSGITQEAEWL